MSGAAYGKNTYWEERYSKDLEPFDWYQRWNGVKHLITPAVKLGAKVLIIGCGTSRLSEDMAHAGYRDVTGIDISPTCINHMIEKCKEIPALHFMDAMQMDYADGTFDAVIDKGTLDTILCAENSSVNSEKLLMEISRVLKPTGIFIEITYGAPPAREGMLRKPQFYWRVDVTNVEKPKVLTSTNTESDVHYVYTMHKEIPK